MSGAVLARPTSGHQERELALIPDTSSDFSISSKSRTFAPIFSFSRVMLRTAHNRTNSSLDRGFFRNSETRSAFQRIEFALFLEIMMWTGP